ncbi:hypothetical protein IG631_07525 [Alternaria alternata]|nr:hypothetical protein IG631_07525 [Alternaria alternata]
MAKKSGRTRDVPFATTKRNLIKHYYGLGCKPPKIGTCCRYHYHYLHWIRHHGDHRLVHIRRVSLEFFQAG